MRAEYHGKSALETCIKRHYPKQKLFIVGTMAYINAEKRIYSSWFISSNFKKNTNSKGIAETKIRTYHKWLYSDTPVKEIHLIHVMMVIML